MVGNLRTKGDKNPYLFRTILNIINMIVEGVIHIHI